MEKVGLIIQGPLTSFGKSGASAARKLNLSADGKEEDGLVRYDCRPNIQRIIDDFGSLFSAVVVSTWDNELKPGDGWKDVTIVSMPDPGGAMDTSPRAYKAHNRNRQFIGIQNGVEWLEKNSDPSYVVFMRTDQYLNLRELLDSFGRHMRRNIPGMICVPFMRPGIFLPSDFYFASELKTMKKFLDAQFSYDRYEFIVDVHRDMVLKYAHSLFRDTLRVPDWAYFPRDPSSGISKQTRTIFARMLGTVFVPLSLRTLQSVEWRGSALSQDYMKSVATEEDLPVDVSKNRGVTGISIPALFSIDWKRYYGFCEIANHAAPSWKENCSIMFGEIGWNVWIMLQGGMRTIKRIRTRIFKGI
ncbi:MAG: WavE lipopolysaccharide synthesis family protein [bacterium]|nr:WavE lipopolysaccharide synthesis family protein [bacterium]